LEPAIPYLLKFAAKDQNSLTTIAVVYGVFLLAALTWFSRQRENEADHLSLEIMHKAGYDIKEAVGVYERLDKILEAEVQERLKKGHRSTGFLGTWRLILR
jgi:predicted Zn-dependent protease